MTVWAGALRCWDSGPFLGPGIGAPRRSGRELPRVLLCQCWTADDPCHESTDLLLWLCFNGARLLAHGYVLIIRFSRPVEVWFALFGSAIYTRRSVNNNVLVKYLN